MSWVYCAPKSKIRIRCAWISEWGVAGAAAARGALAMGASGHPVVGCLLGDADVVHVTFADASGGDTHEHRAGAHLGNVAAAGITHGCTQSAGELVQDGDDAALVRYATLDALRHPLLELGGGVLEVAVGAGMALAHGAERAHAAVGLIRSALVELDLAGRLLGAGEQSADHDGVCAGGDGLGDV